ncbi:hypothetical protein ACHJH3_02955 [Campylobacter sp. MOP7]|uniref:hypothetical protein n=1 Tax=Campylobacter canis TaxID=3378588 RepID=UPI00387E8A2C
MYPASSSLPADSLPTVEFVMVSLLYSDFPLMLPPPSAPSIMEFSTATVFLVESLPYDTAPIIYPLERLVLFLIFTVLPLAEPS